MNDPQEGTILTKILEKRSNKNIIGKYNCNANSYIENNVYLKSFFCYDINADDKDEFEFLPMWVQYGNDAKGCCVLLNRLTFKDGDLRRIIYIDNEGISDDESINIKEFINNYVNILEICTKNEQELTKIENNVLDRINDLLAYIISLISYLFKHETYKHEKEARILETKQRNDLSNVKYTPSHPSKLYVYNKTKTYIDKVIFGSKMDNPEDNVPIIHYYGGKMWKDREDVRKQIEIVKSAIQYR
jgi:hypothetical protein